MYGFPLYAYATHCRVTVVKIVRAFSSVLSTFTRNPYIEPAAMAFRFCTYCRQGCEALCFRQHQGHYRCHDMNCPGHVWTHEPAIHYRRPEANPRLRPEDWTELEDYENGDIYRFPKDPRRDAVHQKIYLEYGAPRPGYRYTYNPKGVAIALPVGEDARDYVAPKHRRESSSRVKGKRSEREQHSSSHSEHTVKSKSKSKSKPHHSHNENRKHSHEAAGRSSKKDAGSRSHRYKESGRSHGSHRKEEEDAPLRPDEIESPPCSSSESEDDDGPKLLEWEVKSLIEGIRDL